MKKLLTLLLIIASLSSFSQGNSVKQDTAAQRKQQEEINKFVSELVVKTSIKDFQSWLYESNAGVKDFEVFNKMYNEFIRQKYAASKAKK